MRSGARRTREAAGSPRSRTLGRSGRGTPCAPFRVRDDVGAGRAFEFRSRARPGVWTPEAPSSARATPLASRAPVTSPRHPRERVSTPKFPPASTRDGTRSVRAESERIPAVERSCRRRRADAVTEPAVRRAARRAGTSGRLAASSSAGDRRPVVQSGTARSPCGRKRLAPEMTPTPGPEQPLELVVVGARAQPYGVAADF